MVIQKELVFAIAASMCCADPVFASAVASQTNQVEAVRKLQERFHNPAKEFKGPSEPSQGFQFVNLYIKQFGRQNYSLLLNWLRISLNVFKVNDWFNGYGDVEGRAYTLFTNGIPNASPIDIWILERGINLHMVQTNQDFFISGTIVRRTSRGSVLEPIYWFLTKGEKGYEFFTQGAILSILMEESDIEISGLAEWSQFSKTELMLLSFCSTIIHASQVTPAPIENPVEFKKTAH